jgi:hypothetical protein
MKQFFGYVRVSTAKQGEKGVSLQEQRDAITQEPLTTEGLFAVGGNYTTYRISVFSSKFIAKLLNRKYS